MIKSRYISTNDSYIKVFKTGSKLRRILGKKAYQWNFVKTGWWSRAYEYKLIQDVVASFFGEATAKKLALDFGCGDSHPGIFVLEKLKFGQVFGCDLFDSHPLLDERSFNISYFKDHKLGPNIKYDLITVISVLEHLEPTLQKEILCDLISMLNDSGVIILTFDMPGFEFETDLKLYTDVFDVFGLSYVLEDIPMDLRLNNFNSIAPFPEGWPSLSLEKSECYRLVGYKKS